MGEKKKILIIDDDPDIRESVKLVLEANNFEIHSAPGAAEGLSIVAREQFDMIICDMMMEEIDSGLKVAEQIRKDNPSIPLFLCSSIGDVTAENIEVRKLGYNGVLQKPLSPDVLINTVKSALKIK